MSYTHKPNTGSLFRNDKREKETHSHAKGSALIDGVEYWVNAWTNETKGGDKYQSLKFTKKEVNTRQNESYGSHREDAPSNFQQRQDFDDDLPF